MNNTVSQTWEKPFNPPEEVPSEAEVVIIGGGIVGVSTAWFLAKKGIKVVLCEKGHIAGEQSGRNWGWVRKQKRDMRELPMMIESMNIWSTLAEEIGENVGFHKTGCIYTAHNEKEMASYEGWMKTAKHFELDTELLSSDELKKHIDHSSNEWIGGLITPSDGRAEPHLASPAIARAAEKCGAIILTSTAVRGIETSAGQVSSVVTEHGPIKASKVLCAAGAWTSMFCRSLNISVPQLKVKGTVCRTEPLAQKFEGEVYGVGLGMRRRADGGYTLASESYMYHSITPSTFRYMFKFLPAFWKEIAHLRLSIGSDFLKEFRFPNKWSHNEISPFEKERVLNPAPDQKVIKEISDNFSKLFPSFEPQNIEESWAGMIETTPDVVPIIEETKKIPGFYIATGFSGHGFGLGPGAGKAIAGMISGVDSGIDLSSFRLDRFFDGSKMVIDKMIT